MYLFNLQIANHILIKIKIKLKGLILYTTLSLSQWLGDIDHYLSQWLGTINHYLSQWFGTIDYYLSQWLGTIDHKLSQLFDTIEYYYPLTVAWYY